MKSVYRALAGLIAIGVVIQAMSVALAWFTALKDIDGGLVLDENSERNLGHNLHSIFGLGIIPLLALLLLIVSFFAHVNGGVKWALIVFGLVILQVVLAIVSFGAPAIGALHGLNAFLLLGAASMAARRAAPAPAVPEQTVTPTTEAPTTEATT
jgi:hypothetical protein